MPESWTIRRVVAWTTQDFQGRGLPSARLDADLLVAHALGVERVGLYLDLDRPLGREELSAIRELVARRRRREPVAYILGRREFYGRPFAVSPAVLVPRPDTELLVERALARLPAQGDARVLDLCTGSGAVALTLAAERPALEVVATDLSPEALEVARRNAEALGVADRVALRPGDLYDALEGEERFDLVVANPPYVTEAELARLDPDVRDHEPRLSLAGGTDGLEVVRRIVEGARARLAPGGGLLIEVGAGQAAAVLALLGAAGLQGACAHRDLSGIDRVVEASAPGA